MGALGLESVLSDSLAVEQKQNRQLREHIMELEYDLEEALKSKCKYWDVCRSTCTIEEKKSASS